MARMTREEKIARADRHAFKVWPTLNTDDERENLAALYQLATNKIPAWSPFYGDGSEPVNPDAPAPSADKGGDDGAE